MMRKFLILPAVAVLTAAAAGASMAEDRPLTDAPRDQWLSVQQLAERLGSQGLQVREIEEDDGSYEVEYIDREGQRMEAKVHPATGEILRSGMDD
ncbi:MAG: hypothetical protein BroJett029_01490 [Alphaproteobacteria bacterium]|nr:MAG: hypothetical protein BroJett029_01490 [Alphaproteobacteria bacterium]